MEKEIRNAIERATQRARKLLEEDFTAQLEGDFDVHRNGVVAATAGAHLSARHAYLRERIVAAIEHKKDGGMNAAEAVADYIRDSAFTTINRFAALKMLEARELMHECISKGEQSAGYREFCGLASGLPILPDSAGYRLYIESVFDELSTEIKILFDRRAPSSVLWPKRGAFEELLDILNGKEISKAWDNDETIGWIYQFFNGQDERKKMREESQSPRSSRELAVRNQFFTPRYVVQFLADNTLGRIWYEMQGGGSILAERCNYLVRRAVQNPVIRAKKDPRDLRVLDPACGSGHFLLYVFDLLVIIYEEAHADPMSPNSATTGRSLREDYPSVESLREALPGLILEHNIHGVDIDARCAQIAQLALWMCCQRVYLRFGVTRAQRPPIRRANIVVAEPLTIDPVVEENFIASLGDSAHGCMFRDLVDGLKLAGDLGLLLHLESLISGQSINNHERSLFAPSEKRIRKALASFAPAPGVHAKTRNRLFVGDTEQGLDLLRIAEMKFDTILMNPPFGEPTSKSLAKLSAGYEDWNKNLICAFIARSESLLVSGGLCGTVVDRTINEKSTYEKFRRRYLLGENFALHLVADLGWGVLDANVEVAALVTGPAKHDHTFLGFDVREVASKEQDLCDGSNAVEMRVREAKRLPNAVVGYFFPVFVVKLFDALPSLREAGFDFFEGHTLKSERYFRVVWESPDNGRDYWLPLFNGTAYSRFAYPHHDVVAFTDASGAMADEKSVLRNTQKHKRSGVCFGKRGEYLDAQMLPSGFISTVEGKACLVPSEEDGWALLALLNSTIFQYLINLYTGQHKYSGYVELIPYPGASLLREASEEARAIVHAKWRLWRHVELSSNFEGLAGIKPTALRDDLNATISEIEEMEKRLNTLVIKAYGLENDAEALGKLRLTSSGVQRGHDLFASSDLSHCAERCVQGAIGRAFGRFSSIRAQEGGRADDGVREILVDDVGHTLDLSALTESELQDEVESVLSEIGVSDLRIYLSKTAFAFHLAYYSRSGRSAPVYWQLSTPSSNYSVWLFTHALTKDTFFRLQNEFIGGDQGKLFLEERRLETIAQELRQNPTAVQRGKFSAQEALVAELQTFLEEVKRVAPLWNPNLDDGVIINFAPLWRLVPHQKPWQKVLKSTWDALCEGRYDWAHLAMHLWPERVVPKCATDRSLAIAHSLEDVFWTKDANNKSIPRSTPTKPIDEIVRKRTSSAVKSALKALLNAPVQSGVKRPSKKGRRDA